MKKGIYCLVFTVLLIVLPRILHGENEGFSFLVNTEWYIDSEIPSREDQQGFFRVFDLPKDLPLYREQIKVKTFYYHYPVGKEKMVWIGRDYNKDGKDDILNIRTRDNYSFFTLQQPEKPYLLFGGGIRQGPVVDPEHPFLGVWNFVDGGFASEVRLVRPGEYRYFMELTEIRGYGIRDGWYLLKYLGNNTFESDDTFEDGYVRLEVRSEKEMILIPLFKLPKPEGLLAPVRLRARG